MTCKIRNCEGPVRARGWCGRHYQQWYTKGRVLRRTRYDPNPVRRRNGYAELGLTNTEGRIMAWAKVDIEDLELLRGRRWGYFRNRYKTYVTSGKGTNRKATLYLHRFLLNAPDSKVVDHLNGDGLDNRRTNLRVCSVRQNNRNSRKSRGGYKERGITPTSSGYSVQISVHGVPTFKEAQRLRRAMEEVAGWSE